MSLANGCPLQPRQHPGRQNSLRRILRKTISVVLLSFLASTQQNQALEDAVDTIPTAPGTSTTVESQVATCPEPSKKTGPEPVSVTISEAKNTLTLACNGAEVSAVPSTLEQGTVCVSGQGKTLKACKENSGSKETTTVSQLLGSESQIVWVPKQKNPSASYDLTIEKKDFPYADKSFFVGCTKNSADDFACQVNVTVEARASTVSGQVATCSYGESSNPSALQIKMTQEKNFFTLVCGKDGTSVPAQFKAEFCPGDDVGECRTTSTYGSILPGFASEWWTSSTDGTQHTLTIPEQHYPTKEQTFLVGCVARTETGTKSQTPACSVKVTLTPKQPDSNAAHAAAGLYIFALTLASSVWLFWPELFGP
ncbi:srs domain-containing protein [Cystoisospora suis]|uniref:Srs domain-containing protein n=1 Tax=Cystoisospora suis TaxID=483139 RepID=A0A2C6L8X3_9APIC|nr:srs domain-containing protein [Cystoisospora suis]